MSNALPPGVVLAKAKPGTKSEGGCKNPQRQRLGAALLDGHRPNNTFGGIPTTATDYSPVWDANVYEWTDEAIRKGYRGIAVF